MRFNDGFKFYDEVFTNERLAEMNYYEIKSLLFRVQEEIKVKENTDKSSGYLKIMSMFEIDLRGELIIRKGGIYKKFYSVCKDQLDQELFNELLTYAINLYEDETAKAVQKSLDE